MMDVSGKLLFLISQPRSGSTLMQRLLTSHSRILTRSEPWLMLYPAYGLKGAGVEAEYDFKLGQVATRQFLEELPGGRQAYVEALRGMYGRLYASCLEGTGCSYFLDKTPRYHLIVPELLELFPAARFVLLVRNPLAVLGSIIDTWTEGNWMSLARYERDLFGAIDSYVDIIERTPEQFCIVHYEELLTDGEAVMRRVFAHLRLDYEPEVLQYHSREAERWALGDAVSVYAKPGIDRDNATRWQRRLDEPQYLRLMHDYLSWIGRERFSRLGYDYDANMALLESRILGVKLDRLRATTLSLRTCTAYGDPAAFTRLLARKLHQRFCRPPAPYPAIVVYGHGSVGSIIGELIPDQVLAFVDRQSTCVTTRIEKAGVYSPENLVNMSYDCILISVLGREQEIARYLVDTLGVDESRIVILDLDDAR